MPTKGGGFKVKVLLGRAREDEREEVLLTKNSVKRVTAIATPPPDFMLACEFHLTLHEC